MPQRRARMLAVNRREFQPQPIDLSFRDQRHEFDRLAPQHLARAGLHIKEHSCCGRDVGEWREDAGQRRRQAVRKQTERRCEDRQTEQGKQARSP